MSYIEDQRVMVLPLGVKGTVTRVWGDGRYTVLADPSTQAVVWAEKELAAVDEDGPLNPVNAFDPDPVSCTWAEFERDNPGLAKYFPQGT